MAAEKFIRVSVVLPAGVKVTTESGIPRSSSSVIDRMMREAFQHSWEQREVTTESTGPLTVTLECPEAKRQELASAFQRLFVELVG